MMDLLMPLIVTGSVLFFVLGLCAALTFPWSKHFPRNKHSE